MSIARQLVRLPLDEGYAASIGAELVSTDLLRRLGRRAEAAAAYRQALAWVTKAAERRFLERQLHEVTGQAP